MLKLLGLMDVVSAVVFVFVYFGFFKTAGILFGLYILAKGIFFFGGMASFFDLISGSILFVFLYTGFSAILLWAAAVWLIQKGIVSIFSSS